MNIYILIFSLVLCCSSFASSQQDRSDKKLELTYQAGMDYTTLPTQLSAMYFINGDQLIGLKAGVHKGNNSHQTNFALQYKHFFSNSFYGAGEVFYLNTREDVDGWIATLRDREYARYISLGSGIRIGNQWTMKHFTFGVDWIGVGKRFGTFKKESHDLNTTTLTVCNLIIGFSF